MNVPGYEKLAEVLEAAFDQAANGKGKERHANDLPFPEQRMLGISRLLDSDGGMAYQACKKVTEARGLKHDARERELLGAIVYIAGMVLFHRERQAASHPVPSILEPVNLADLMNEEREIREEWDERRMDIIGQNGNDGLHYDALPGGLGWDRAPEWSTDLGRVGSDGRLVWYNAERYEYVVSGAGFHFGDGTRSLCSIINIARRPVIDMKKQPIKRNVCLSCGGGHALHKCQGGADE